MKETNGITKKTNSKASGVPLKKLSAILASRDREAIGAMLATLNAIHDRLRVGA